MYHFESNVLAVVELPSTTPRIFFLVLAATVVLTVLFWLIGCIASQPLVDIREYRSESKPRKSAPSLLHLELTFDKRVRRLEEWLWVITSHDATVLKAKKAIEEDLETLMRNVPGAACFVINKDVVNFFKGVSMLLAQTDELRQHAEADRTHELQTLLQQFREKYTRDEPHIPST